MKYTNKQEIESEIHKQEIGSEIDKQDMGSEIDKPRGLNGSMVALSWIHMAGSKLNNSRRVCCACLVHCTQTHQQYSDGHESRSACGNGSIQKQHMAGGNV